MKKLLKAISIALVLVLTVMLLFYVCMLLYNGQWNIASWSEGSREGFVAMFISSLILACIVSSQIVKNE
jgi:hypothetical protein